MVALKFGRDNAKLCNLMPYLPKYLAFLKNYDAPALFTFSKLSGHTCPYAKECLSRAVETPAGRRIEDGKYTQFRCYSASQEVLFTGVYNQRKHNTDLMKACTSVKEYRELITGSLPDKCNVLRIHIGGDISNQMEFDGWIEAAETLPHVLFYAYTKSLPFWVARFADIPKNLVLTASYGGFKDALIEKHKLVYAKVVGTPQDAKKLRLPVDHDDSHAANPMKRKPFALLIHGTQPKGKMKASYGYSR